MRLRTIILPLLACAAPVGAEPGLPDEASVAGALLDHPAAAAARERLTATRSAAEARAAGPHELTVSGSYNRRSIDREGDFDEFDTQLTRAFRLPGKERLDREIGMHDVDAAQNLAEDARHQVALMLAEYWWNWLGAAAQVRVDGQAVENYERALAAIRRRIELGDAAELEGDQAEAALGAARVLAEQSRGEASLARARLEAQFPTLALPAEAPEIPSPSVMEDQVAELGGAVVRNSHEIAAAQALARRAASYAQRLEAERVADPTFGVRLFSERGGEERGAGLVFSMPLGGRYRRALAEEAGSQATAAIAEERLARFAVEETASADLAEVRFRQAAWQRARASLVAQMSMLEKLRRGRQLGETDLTELLLGERMVHDAFRTEIEARTAAQRAITKLRIDAHELWLQD